jgi:signal transduction histidine kinase
MHDRVMVRALRGTVAAGVIASLVGFSGLVALDGIAGVLAGGLFMGVLLPIGFGAIAWVAAPSQPSNRLLWVLAAFTAATGVYMVGQVVMGVVAPEVARPLDVDTTVPSTLPLDALSIEAVTVTLATAGQYALLTFGLLLFPDGRLPSRRWRPVAWFIGVGLFAMPAGVAASWSPANDVAVSQSPYFHMGNVFFIGGPVTALAGLAMRYRRGDQVTRSRFKWIIWGAALFVPLTVLGSASAFWGLTLLGAVALVGGYGVAITRHRLFDVDVVISRTFVFGALAAFITGVYVAIVVGLGRVFGSTDEPNTALALTATAVIAIAFQPLRRQLERVANRLVFGRRATPYEVLSEFSRAVAATGDTVLTDAARSLAEGTRADRIAVSVAQGGELAEVTSWPAEPSDAPTAVVQFPIEHDGVTLGSLDVHLGAGEDLRGDDRRLAAQLASGMGLALRNELLTERLEARVDELRESRRRLVAVQDDTRRRLERDLHDGAQQQLVALKVKLGLARALAEKAGATETTALLERLGGDADGAVNALRDFARGVYPPLLEAEGLGAALAAQARRAPLPVTVEPDGVGRYDRDVEATVYFCVREALRNTVRHAEATQARVILGRREGTLVFEVRDDGVGFDPGSSNGYTGLTTMTDRVDALAGTLQVASRSGEGTAITGAIPVDEVTS